jgi:glutamyl-tRNA synthetase
MTSATPVRVRFAPSPTGHLHIGSLRAAIFNWLFARASGGTYLLRIEDTDVLRSKQEYVDSILTTLTWSNLMPDESVVFQMSRLDEHKKAVDQLLAAGHAYRCFCPPVDAEERISQLDAGVASKYPGTCRDLVPTAEDLKRPHAIRFKLNKEGEKFQFTDIIRGELAFDYDQFDDFVIVRQDGVPTYNFVVVVDDIFMRISHVIRGEDHIYNTPKQIFLYNAFGAPLPQFAHLPLILSPAGGRLSKRDGAVAAADYKAQGFLPDALINYLVRLGWSAGDQELFTRDEMVKLFALEDIGKSGAVFDIKKLEWVNGNYVRQSSVADILKGFGDLEHDYLAQLKAAWTETQLAALIELYKERTVRLRETALDLIALSHDPQVLDLALIEKVRTPQTVEILAAFAEKLADTTLTDEPAIAAAGKAVLEQFNAKLPALGVPLRLALTGTTSSPGIFHLIALLPREMVLRRITKLVAALRS